MNITLATLPKATAQQVFDHISRHLLHQNERSNEHGKCLYYSSNSLKCAAGCLISDEEYFHLAMHKEEDQEWSTLVYKGTVPPQHLELISALQDVHDASIPQHWVQRLHGVAEKFNLEFKPS